MKAIRRGPASVGSAAHSLFVIENFFMIDQCIEVFLLG